MGTPEIPLRRVLSLPLLTLYGVGTIVGAGFYALLGEVAGLAGTAAPAAMLLAGIVASFSALSFAELASRYPESGGPVRYVEAATGSSVAGRATGGLMIFTGVVSAATLARAVGRFLEDLYGVSPELPIVLTVIALSTVAAWGMRVSGILAAIVTLLEVGVLVAIPFLRADVLPTLPERMHELAPGAHAPWSGVLLGTFLVFYAFVGFEDMVTLAEEVENPRRNLPRAILIALLVTTVLYAGVTTVAVLAVDPARLSQETSPLALLVQERGSALRPTIVWVGVLAGLNGALIQIVMAARIFHGMRAQRGPLAWLGAVHPRTRTPLRGTVSVGMVVLTLALAFPLVVLASWTSAILLLVFAAVNAALIAIHIREPRSSGFQCPRWAPWIGLVLCLGLLSVELVRAATS